MDSYENFLVDEYSEIAVVVCKIIGLVRNPKISIQSSPMGNKNRETIAILAMDCRMDDDHEFVQQITNN